MPTLQDRQRNEEIRQYFRRELAQNLSSVDAAKPYITERFGVSNAHWYRLRGNLHAILRDVKSTAKQGVVEERPQTTISIPNNLEPKAKEAINGLLDQNQDIERQLLAKEVEAAGLRSDLARLRVCCNTLKTMVEMLMKGI